MALTTGKSADFDGAGADRRVYAERFSSHEVGGAG
jgi:hypothetical protein